MARTRLFGIANRALQAAGLAAGPRALSRRTLLQGAAAVSLAACAPREIGPAPRIAIVGGGAAGLTIAYRLSKAGKAATLYEASNRLGGRMFTRRNFNPDGQFCELGGELVDSNHAALRALAGELGVAIDRLAPEDAHGETLYHFGGTLYTSSDMLRDGVGAFAPIAARVAQDRAGLLDADDNWTEAARQLDAISLADYLAGFEGQAPAWALQLLDIAYRGEFGIPTREQSALNLIDFIGVEPSSFQMFGESDEAWRIRGGSSSLTDALAAQLGGAVTPALTHRLTGIARDGGVFALDFAGPQGAVQVEADIVALALPFTMLRDVAGVDALGLDPLQLRAIRELGYGDNSKIMVSTTAKPWTQPQSGWPEAVSGEFYSDRFQLAWDTSRGQPGARGVITNFLAGQQDEAAGLADLRAGLAALSPAMAESLDPAIQASFFWARHPFTRGSYAGAKVGQYTTLLGLFDAPALDGALHFAGEHTSAEFLGFMNGAVDSGERAARAILS